VMPVFGLWTAVHDNVLSQKGVLNHCSSVEDRIDHSKEKVLASNCS